MNGHKRVALSLLVGTVLAACGTTEPCPAPPPRPNVETTRFCQGFNWGPVRPIRVYLEYPEPASYVTPEQVSTVLEALGGDDGPAAPPEVDRAVADADRRLSDAAAPVYKAFVETNASLDELDTEDLLRAITDVNSACSRAGVQMP